MYVLGDSLLMLDVDCPVVHNSPLTIGEFVMTSDMMAADASNATSNQLRMQPPRRCAGPKCTSTAEALPSLNRVMGSTAGRFCWRRYCCAAAKARMRSCLGERRPAHSKSSVPRSRRQTPSLRKRLRGGAWPLFEKNAF